jgi:hypothetical protein
MFGNLAKLAMGGGAPSPEQLGMLLKGLGVDLRMEPVTLENAPAALKLTAAAAGRSGASLHRLNGRMKDGSTLVAFIVLSPGGKESLQGASAPALLHR